jgi:mannose-6-phosphate isomerase
LKPGVDAAQLKRSLDDGNCDECLHSFEPKIGDCVFVGAGTVHAIGAGLLIAEIQQASDTTFRLFDWNRVDNNGRPRELHIEQALTVINFDRGPVSPISQERVGPLTSLVECDKFVLDRWELEHGLPAVKIDRFHILAVVDGAVTLSTGGTKYALYRGDTTLIPACCAEVTLGHDERAGKQKLSPDGSPFGKETRLIPQGRAVVLDMYLP